jgi:hypothetical protein
MRTGGEMEDMPSLQSHQTTKTNISVLAKMCAVVLWGKFRNNTERSICTYAIFFCYLHREFGEIQQQISVSPQKTVVSFTRADQLFL